MIAGLGNVGQGVLAIKDDWFASYGTVIGVDRDAGACRRAGNYGIAVQQGDITDPVFLEGLSESLPGPILFVNCCTGIDTVRLRKHIQNKPIGYIDICESEMPGNPRSRFSVGMPYTNQPYHGDYPHWICQGINPGLMLRTSLSAGARKI